MPGSLTRTAVVPLAFAGLLSTGTACSSGPDVVNKSDVVNQIGSKMTDASGNKPDSVSCPNELAASVGATTNCEMKIKDLPYGVNVTVTSVEGDSVKFDLVETVDKSQVASEISDRLGEQIGRKPEAVTCPDNLKGVEGATLQCDLTDGAETYGVTVTVTQIDGGDVNFDFKVDDHPR